MLSIKNTVLFEYFVSTFYLQNVLLWHTFFILSFRYLQPPATWIAAQLESKELLSICLKKLKELNRVRISSYCCSEFLYVQTS